MLRDQQAFSAVGSRNLGKRQRRDSHSRRTLPAFALKSIVRSKKTKRAIGELFLIPDAPLRHIDDEPRHDLAHSTGIGRPTALASRLEEPVPGLIEGRTELTANCTACAGCSSKQVHSSLRHHPSQPLIRFPASLAGNASRSISPASRNTAIRSIISVRSSSDRIIRIASELHGAQPNDASGLVVGRTKRGGTVSTPTATPALT